VESDVEAKYRRAGRAVRRALKLALDIVEEGAPLLSIAERLENEVRVDASPAFPVNISINAVAAHYSPKIGDEKVIPKGAVVKVDVGAHVDGYIADGAITIVLDERYSELARAALEGLKAAYRVLRPGVRLGEIGACIERSIRRLGYRPIANLSGHKVEQYRLHAGKSVPNVATFTLERVKEGEVYAIEPFSTNGRGLVVEGEAGNIYRVISLRRVKEDKSLDAFLKQLWSRYRGLPFSERWLTDLLAPDKVRLYLYKLVSARKVYLYPTLVEKRGGVVAQFEDTFIVTPEGPIPLIDTLSLVT